MTLSDALEILQRELTEHGDRELKRGPDSLAQLLSYLTRDTTHATVAALDLVACIRRFAKPGELISIKRLRFFVDLPRVTFDNLLRNAALAGEVSLFRHDFPHSLPASVRAQLLQIDDAYYNAVALRPVSSAPRTPASV